ncbi:Na+/H+ antiporter NhaA [Candidatus Saccharibacteria bacterium]|nr:Na+/H+ antiporter NhaA [Candidatus Saccharibacteria bacterium]
MIKKILKSIEYSRTSITKILFADERKASILLLLVAIIALILANSAWSSNYFEIVNNKVSFLGVTLSLQHWVNEGLMALFFLMVSIEIKRELIDGELKGWKRASFPVVAAIGGMLLPALIFSLINPINPYSNGWAIPMATDIAIAVTIIGLLGKRVPKYLKSFLLALAIVDDLGAILIISLYYNQPSNYTYLILVGILVALLWAIRKTKKQLLWFGILGSIILWLLLASGVSGTLAGVLVGFLMPLVSSKNVKTEKAQPSEELERVLIPLVLFVIVPLFVLVNAGVNFSSIVVTSSEDKRLIAGIVLGLVIGKPLGVLLFSYVANFFKITHKPNNISWSQIVGVGFIAGIGFTMALFITNLAFKGQDNLINIATVSIFIGSIMSAVTGIMVLFLSKRKHLNG